MAQDNCRNIIYTTCRKRNNDFTGSTEKKVLKFDQVLILVLYFLFFLVLSKPAHIMSTYYTLFFATVKQVFFTSQTTLK